MANTHTVVWGDTLWDIAAKYLGDPMKYTYLAKINGISDPNHIVVGQVILLSSGNIGSATSTIKPRYVRPTIKVFGLQSGTDRTIFATWQWDRTHTDHYQVWWEYDTGDGVWFIADKGTVNDKQSLYNAPSNAKRVRFWVKPFAQTYKVNDQDVEYWTADWSEVRTYTFKEKPPEAPSAPTVTITDYTLKAELSNIDMESKPTAVVFEIVRDNSKVFNNVTVPIRTSYASYSCKISVGFVYKVRCRLKNRAGYGKWSEYSNNVGTRPAASGGITTCRANSETSVYLSWKAVSNCTSYDVEYTTNSTYFGVSDEVTRKTGIEKNIYIATGLETGQRYFFRVRAVNSEGESPWTQIASVVIGKKPAAPTTWSSATTVIAGEPLTLYWVHNTEDNSDETYAEVELYISGRKETYTVQKPTSESEKDKTSHYSIDTSKYTEGTVIQWRVRTAGITKQYGDWSVQRTIDIYAPPTLELEVTNAQATPIDVITTFPFYISALAGPNTQAPIGYHLTITANESYETVDFAGNPITINKGDEVYSKHFDIKSSLKVQISAGDVDLENNIDYTVSCIVSMNSGLTAEAKRIVTVTWTDESYQPNAEIGFDNETYVTYIRPYCEEYNPRKYKVTYDEITKKYMKTSTIIDDTIEGLSIDGAFTETGEMVFKPNTTVSGISYFCIAFPSQGTPIKDVLLSVFRREFDGSYTELATDLDNMKNTFVTDPHPALDYARYRIVAMTKSTGAISYYDMPGYPIGEKSVIIQWDEEWTNFNVTSEDALSQPPWTGSLLKLPYNVDISDSHSSDVEMIEYIGRKRPVSYYGTQLGETSTWNMEIDREDKESLYQLRRLAVWMGDAYVREPSGSGYWANINVSFSQKHCEVTIPVTLEITRVEGGA